MLCKVTSARIHLLVVSLVICVAAAATRAQTSGFLYQGRLTDGGTAANGNYDLQFALWDSASGGTQIGSTVTLNTVAVSNGVFSASLDFGASSFNGASRFLEISARPVSGAAFTLLSPRQQITATPYAIRSANASLADNATNATSATNATQLGGVAAGQYVQTSDSRLSDARTPIAGSSNYIQNTTSQQSSTNFSISGTGTASILNATTQFNLNGGRIIGTYNGGGNGGVFVGFAAGTSNTNSTAGSDNAFFGNFAGQKTTDGANNSFFGSVAGNRNTTGGFNSFFGAGAGLSNVVGENNSYFGGNAGNSNTVGNDNSLFGAAAGTHVVGSFNTFVGSLADFGTGNNSVGDNNTLLGASTTVGVAVDNGTAIGFKALVTQNNSLVLGSINGKNGAIASTSVGIGITAPLFRLHVVDPGAAGLRVQTNTAGGAVASFGGNGDFQVDANGVTGGRFLVQEGGNVGIGTNAPDAKLTVNGTVDKPGGGSWGTFSDERLKNLKGRFTPGLRSVMQLQPLRYEYKSDNALGIKSEGEHIGFSAQAVQKVIPEAVSANDKGYLVVNNDPILWTMLNAIKEQQAQIEALRMANATLNARLRTVERTMRQQSGRRHRGQ